MLLGFAAALAAEVEVALVEPGAALFRDRDGAFPVMVQSSRQPLAFRVIAERDGWVQVSPDGPSRPACPAAMGAAPGLDLPLWVPVSGLVTAVRRDVALEGGGWVRAGWVPPAEETAIDAWIRGQVPADAWGWRLAVTPAIREEKVYVEGFDGTWTIGTRSWTLPVGRHRSPWRVGEQAAIDLDGGCVRLVGRAGTWERVGGVLGGVIGGRIAGELPAWIEVPAGVPVSWPDGEAAGRVTAPVTLWVTAERGTYRCGQVDFGWVGGARSPEICVPVPITAAEPVPPGER